MDQCFRCGSPLTETEEDLCNNCRRGTAGLPPQEPAFQRASGRLIWRAKQQLAILHGSDDAALKAQLREAARLLLAACLAIEEER
jgi:hypothetical protein